MFSISNHLPTMIIITIIIEHRSIYHYINDIMYYTLHKISCLVVVSRISYMKQSNKYRFSFIFIAGGLVLLWRRGANVLTASQLMVTRDERIRLIDGYNLEITELEPQDAGDYVCQICDKVNIDQIHTVEILGKFWKCFLLVFDKMVC